MTKNKIKKYSLNFNYRLIIALFIIMATSLLTGLTISTQTNNIINKKIAEVKEAARPADLEIISIVDANCDDCFSLALLIENLKKQNVNVVKEEELKMSEEKAKELINQFNISKVPVLLVKGEIRKNKVLESSWEKLGEIKDDTFVLTEIAAPHTLTSTGEIKGRVNLIMLTDDSCAECYKVAIHERILGSFGISARDKSLVEVSSAEGKELIRKYAIKLLPTIILTGDIASYPAILTSWPKIGTVEEDGSYIFRDGVRQMGSYKDLSTGQVIKPLRQTAN